VWIPLAHILRPENHLKFEHQFEDRNIEMTCIEYGGYRIWGMTYRMIQNFLKAIG